jgi:hypothetical protein
MAGQRESVPLVLCSGSHRYSGWGVCPPGSDLALWLARRELVAKCRWEATDFLADQTYLSQLREAAGGRLANVSSCLVMKN